MSAQPIQWHEECLIAKQNHLARRTRELDNLFREVKQSEEQVNAYAAQIQRAKKLGKTEFDRERFGVKRSKNL